MIHELKCQTPWFDALMSERKRFEIRRNDRNFKVGDTLNLREWNHGEYSGRQTSRKVIYITSFEDFPEGLGPGYVVLGIS